MAECNYALDRQEYTLTNALLWGNCVGHYIKARQYPWVEKSTWGNRTVHIIIAVLEYLPIIGQIVSLFEMTIVKCCTHGVKYEELDPKKETEEPETIKNTTLKIEITSKRKEGEKSPPKTPSEEGDLTSSKELIPGEILIQKEGE